VKQVHYIVKPYVGSLKEHINIFNGCVDSRKFTFGYIFLLAKGPMWINIKHVATTSTKKSKFVVYFEATIEDCRKYC